ncbi:GNAT family N-acetyltransferase [Paenibacillus sp. GCM10023248]|uniref:GNAT family N-acetyltransferase n=1 Tax=unclassified Paenibacillus TaxID=185978 RepID=UPI0023785F72|nr:GNAT family N-acetyltransferase [Paenibacillus sp. MAHUQ-63]MDD9268149.1 GNAT family N-acetyltransferase [Paenibacillus sp. MAHUQ-63]
MTSYSASLFPNQLEFYTSAYREALFSFHLPEEQQQFTGMPRDMLPIALEDEHRYPVCIVADGRPVGFFILYDGEERFEYSDHANSLVLRAFSINHAEQGHGHAKAALLQLKAFVSKHFPAVAEIALAVNFKNDPARHVYLCCGFYDSGRTKMGRNGGQHILVMPVV